MTESKTLAALKLIRSGVGFEQASRQLDLSADEMAKLSAEIALDTVQRQTDLTRSGAARLIIARAERAARAANEPDLAFEQSASSARSLIDRVLATALARERNVEKCSPPAFDPDELDELREAIELLCNQPGPSCAALSAREKLEIWAKSNNRQPTRK